MYSFIKYSFFRVDDSRKLVVDRLKELERGESLGIILGEENLDNNQHHFNLIKEDYELFKKINSSFKLIFNETYTKFIDKTFDKNHFTIFNVDLFNSYLPVYLGFQDFSQQYDVNKKNVNVLLKFGNFGNKWRLHVLLSLLKKLPNNLLYGFHPERFWKDADIDDYYKEIIIHKNINKKDIKDFLKTLSNNLDIDTNRSRDEMYAGFPYKTWPYEKSILSVICETNTPFEYHHDVSTLNVTEKTYQVITNHHPFILFGTPNQLQRLKDNNFYTFEDMLPNSRYNDVNFIHSWNLNKQKYFVKVIEENVEWFLKKIKQDNELQQHITEMCDYNHQNLKQLFNEILMTEEIFNDENDLIEYFKTAYNFSEVYQI